MINFKRVFKERNVSIREVSEMYGIPYATLYAIVNEKADVKECKYATIKRLSVFLGIPMDYIDMPDEAFINFRSELHHEIKRNGIKGVRERILNNRMVTVYMYHEEYVKALYLVSLLEYTERRLSCEESGEVKKYKKCMLSEPFYFGDISNQNKDDYIEEFACHNIMEGSLDDAV